MLRSFFIRRCDTVEMNNNPFLRSYGITCSIIPRRRGGAARNNIRYSLHLSETDHPDMVQ